MHGILLAMQIFVARYLLAETGLLSNVTLCIVARYTCFLWQLINRNYIVHGLYLYMQGVFIHWTGAWTGLEWTAWTHPKIYKMPFSV